MTRVLTVDDSRAIRSIVSKQLKDLGFEVDEAENGEEGLAMLEECHYEIVVLDVTMPVMDGPEMLKRMREGGNKTPVLMLTSESKRSIIADLMKLGIDDYILKPFKPDELRAKIAKTLKVDGPPGAVAGAVAMPVDSMPSAPRAHGGGAPAEGGGGDARDFASKQFVDVLVVDDMENVQKKLRGMLPDHISLNGVVSAQAAINICRERVYRLVLLDADMPDVNSVVLMGQLKVLQPNAAFLAMALRTANDAKKEALADGYNDILFKPFDQGSMDDFLGKYFDNQDLLLCEDYTLHVKGFTGREERVEGYYQRVAAVLPAAMEKLAAACFEEAIIDMSQLPIRQEHTPGLVMEADKLAKKMGLGLRVVGNKEAQVMLKKFTETGSVPFFLSVNEAKAAAA